MDIKKSIELKDAHIHFVSLVDKAANKKQFLITKQEDGDAQFATLGRIIKVDKESHFVTGVVYEPMTADAHDNFMTEEEIEKAAHWYMKNGDKVDIQHSFEEAKDLFVVESSVAKADCTIEDEEIKKGTWLMTVEVADPTVWEAIEKGEITGLSMGGVGKYAKEDVTLEKAEATKEAPISAAIESHETKESLFKRLAKAMGFGIVEKGEVKDEFNKASKAQAFWTAWYSLDHILRKYDSWKGDYVFETDESKIREALTDFTDIITSLLMDKDFILVKALGEAHPVIENDPVEKAGKKMSSGNKAKLKGICDSLTQFLKEFDDDTDEDKDDETIEKADREKEDETDMNKEEIQKMIDESIAKGAKPVDQVNKAEKPVEAKPDQMTAETVEKMISDAVEKALKNPDEHDDGGEANPTLTTEQVAKMIDTAISGALKARGVPTNMDNQTPIEKTDQQHYLHGIL